MALEGSFNDMTLADLFQVFQSGRKSGVLMLSSGPERGVIYVWQGKLLDAVLLRSNDKQITASAEEAVLAMLRWEEALFTFRHDVSTQERPRRIMHDPDWLMLEAIKRSAAQMKLPSYQKLSIDSCLQMSSMPNSTESNVQLDLNQWRVLSQIAISERLRDICAGTGISHEEGLRIAGQLIAVGLIEIADYQPMKQEAHSVQALLNTPYKSPDFAEAGTKTTAPSGRGLLGAIKRRIRGL